MLFDQRYSMYDLLNMIKQYSKRIEVLNHTSFPPLTLARHYLDELDKKIKEQECNT